jgi:hypothetical protein
MSASGFTANWTGPSGTAAISNYQLDVATNPGFTSFVSGYQNLTVSSTSAPVTGLKSGTYYYRVRAVNAGGTSGNSNTITVVFTPPPTISVTYPVGGETFAAGGKYTITWSYTGNPGSNVKIELLNGSVASPITSSTSIGKAGAGSYSWTVPSSQALGKNYKVRVTSTSNSSYTATSPNSFIITGPSIGITSPTGGSWNAGSKYTISWTYAGNPGSSVSIALLQGGSKVSTIASSTSAGSNGKGSYTWTIPTTQGGGTNYQVQVSSTTISSCTATSSNFTIVGPSISVTSPNGGETWSAGEKHNITWSYQGNPGVSVKIELVKGSATAVTIVSSTSIGSGGSGHYAWSLPATLVTGSDYRVRVSSTANSSLTSMSHGAFTIKGGISISVTSPAGGETWAAGSTHNITWSYLGSPGSTVNIQLLSQGAVASSIKTAASIGKGGSGSYPWTIPKLTAGSSYQVQITSTANSFCTSISNNFTIAAAKASAGPDQKVSRQASVKLSGSNSTGVGAKGITYLWTQLDGPAVAIANPSAIETGFVAPYAGFEGKSLRFQLTVTSADGAKSQDECIVNVIEDGVPPKADAGPTQLVAEFQIVELDGSKSSAPDGGGLSYSWRQVSGVAVNLSEPSAAKPTIIAPDADAAGEALAFELTVTDAAGLRSRDTCIVNVVSNDLPPAAKAGPNRTVSPGGKVVLDGSGSTDETGGRLSYGWKQIAGPPVKLSDPAAVKPSFLAPTVDAPAEDLVFELTVASSAGLQDKAKTVVTFASVVPVK